MMAVISYYLQKRIELYVKKQAFDAAFLQIAAENIRGGRGGGGVGPVTVAVAFYFYWNFFLYYQIIALLFLNAI